MTESGENAGVAPPALRVVAENGSIESPEPVGSLKNELAGEETANPKQRPTDNPQETQEIEKRLLELAGLPRLEYEQLRQSEAKKLHCRVAALDDEVEKRRAHDIAGTTASEEYSTQSDLLVQLGRESELWHDKDGDAFAMIEVDGHRENHRVRSPGFRLWLLEKFWSKYSKAPGGQATADALRTIEAIARFEGEEHKPFVRLGRCGGRIYIDLGDDSWRSVEVADRGWKVIPDPPVRFIRPKGMRPLPEPERGGSIQKLQHFINVGKPGNPEADQTMRLLIGCLVGMFSGGPFPILAFYGEHGTAKSTACRIIRKLIDPNMAPLRAQPKDERDLLIAACHSAVLIFDNLSGLPTWLSDGLCRLATGSGLGTRQLYTDAEEILFDAMRPVVINGISDLAIRPDLVDRAICLTLLKIDDTDRKTETAFWADFDDALPGILGAIFDGIATALERQKTVHKRAEGERWSLPRMSDFALWVEAAAPAFGWQECAFMNDYAANRKDAIGIALEADVLVPYIRSIAKIGFEGTATELLNMLTARDDDGNPKAGAVSDEVMRRKQFPKQANHLSGQLRLMAPGLRQFGIKIDLSRTKQGSHIVIQETAECSGS